MSDTTVVSLTPRCKAEQTILGHVEAMMNIAMKDTGLGIGSDVLTLLLLRKKKPLLKLHITCIKNALATMEEEIRG